MSLAISKQTNDSLARVMAFFGIDEYNRPLFRKAAESCGVETFVRFIGAMDAVVQMDSRYSTERRIRAALSEGRKRK